MADSPAPDQSSALTSEKLIAELYAELRRLAAAKLNKIPPGQTLQATALVHEAYLRLSHNPSQNWQNRAHFFGAAAEAMRRILVDQARRKSALRRGSGATPEPLDELQLAQPEPDDRILAVHEALELLEVENPALAQIVKLRFFSRLSHDEIAALLEISEKTARRQWNAAKISLYQKISGKNEQPFDRFPSPNTD